MQKILETQTTCRTWRISLKDSGQCTCSEVTTITKHARSIKHIGIFLRGNFYKFICYFFLWTICKHLYVYITNIFQILQGVCKLTITTVSVILCSTYYIESKVEPTSTIIKSSQHQRLVKYLAKPYATHFSSISRMKMYVNTLSANSSMVFMVFLDSR